uniref:Phenoloxidase-activating factor 2 n=1 Tax=Octodonta nipae TaxID=1432747 RepID=A0A2D0XRY1_9CUCU|nr:prophenoloxidase activating factor 2 [Octodonta nipae]
MNFFWFTIVFSFFRLGSFISTTISNDIIEYQSHNQNYCICVPYYQCKEDYSGLAEDVIDIVDVRSAMNGNYDTERCVGYFDVCCKVQCGLGKSFNSNDDIHQTRLEKFFGYRILGENNEAEFAEFPWMLGILEDKTYRCGGSLIHPQVALTAAHCVTRAGPFTVRAGEWNWEALSEPIPHQDRNTKKVIIHPQYHPGSLRNDVALLILEKPFRLTRNVIPTCLPNKGARFDYQRCLTMGWGKNSHKRGTYQPVLKKLELPIVPREKCLKVLQSTILGTFFNLHESFICAGGEALKDTCKGDGGGPLMCPILGQPGRYQQVGIVSWGITCGLQNTPGVYANIAIFVDWIDFTLSRHGFDSSIYKY